MTYRSVRCLRDTRLRPSPYPFQTTQPLFSSISPFSTTSTRYSKRLPVTITDTALATNPPTSTLPPPLHLPVRQPDSSTFSYYFSLGKAYVNFYKTGIKSIYENYRLSRALSSRIAPHTPEDALKHSLLSRGEYLLLRRTRDDVRKIPLFLLLYIVCGEFTPLAVVLFSGMVPRTLWIPKQVQNSRQKLEKRRIALTHPPHRSTAMAQDVIAQGQLVGCYPLWWDRLPIPPIWFIRKRVERRSYEINLDDFALQRDGGVQAVKGEEEIRRAAEFRGINVLGKPEEELRGRLEDWLLLGSLREKKEKTGAVGFGGTN